MTEENTYFTDQLFPLEGYTLTLYDVTSSIKADRLLISVKYQTGKRYTPSSCFGIAKTRFKLANCNSGKSRNTCLELGR